MKPVSLILSKDMAGSVQNVSDKIQQYGYTTVLVSNITNDPNTEYCDGIIHFDWNNGRLDDLLHYLSEQSIKPNAIVCLLESLMPWQATLSKELSLDYLYIDSLLSLADKSQLRKRNGKLKHHTDYLHSLSSGSIDFYPCIIKPTIDSGGSKNVFTSFNFQELNTCIRAIQNESPNNNEPYIIEEYIKGIEYTCDGFVENRAFIPVFYSEKIDFDYANNEDGKHILSPPTSLNKKCEDDIIQQISALIESSNLDRGCLHVEFRVHDGIATIIEVNPRFGGRLYSTAINYHFNINPLDIFIKSQLNFEYTINGIKKNIFAYTYLLLMNFKHHQGKLTKYTPLSYFNKNQNYIDGYVIDGYRCCEKKIENIFAEFLIGANTIDELMDIEKKLRNDFKYTFI